MNQKKADTACIKMAPIAAESGHSVKFSTHFHSGGTASQTRQDEIMPETVVSRMLKHLSVYRIRDMANHHNKSNTSSSAANPNVNIASTAARTRSKSGSNTRRSASRSPASTRHSYGSKHSSVSNNSNSNNENDHMTCGQQTSSTTTTTIAAAAAHGLANSVDSRREGLSSRRTPSPPVNKHRMSSHNSATSGNAPGSTASNSNMNNKENQPFCVSPGLSSSRSITSNVEAIVPHSTPISKAALAFSSNKKRHQQIALQQQQRATQQQQQRHQDPSCANPSFPPSEPSSTFLLPSSAGTSSSSSWAAQLIESSTSRRSSLPCSSPSSSTTARTVRSNTNAATAAAGPSTHLSRNKAPLQAFEHLRKNNDTTHETDGDGVHAQQKQRREKKGSLNYGKMYCSDNNYAVIGGIKSPQRLTRNNTNVSTPPGNNTNSARAAAEQTEPACFRLYNIAVAKNQQQQAAAQQNKSPQRPNINLPGTAQQRHSSSSHKKAPETSGATNFSSRNSKSTTSTASVYDGKDKLNSNKKPTTSAPVSGMSTPVGTSARRVTSPRPPAVISSLKANSDVKAQVAPLDQNKLPNNQNCNDSVSKSSYGIDKQQPSDAPMLTATSQRSFSCTSSRSAPVTRDHGTQNTPTMSDIRAPIPHSSCQRSSSSGVYGLGGLGGSSTIASSTASSRSQSVNYITRLPLPQTSISSSFSGSASQGSSRNAVAAAAAGARVRSDTVQLQSPHEQQQPPLPVPVTHSSLTSVKTEAIALTQPLTYIPSSSELNTRRSSVISSGGSSTIPLHSTPCDGDVGDDVCCWVRRRNPVASDIEYL